MASEPKPQYQATARVTVTVEIRVDDAWGEDCSMGQIVRQATESARGVLSRMRKKPEHPLPFTIVGEPTVKAIFVDRASKGESE